jgi:hypothetical protein
VGQGENVLNGTIVGSAAGAGVGGGSGSVVEGSDCGKTVTVTYNGQTATGIVVDKCMGCDNGSVDLSPWGRARTFSTVPSLVVPQELGLVEVVAVS